MRRVSILRTLLWGLLTTLVIAAGFYLMATRTAPLTDWFAGQVGPTAALTIVLAGLLAALVLLPSVAARRIVRGLELRKLEPHTSAILMASLIATSLGFGIGAWFFGSTPAVEMLVHRGLWLPTRVLGQDSAVLHRLSDLTGLGVYGQPVEPPSLPANAGREVTSESATSQRTPAQQRLTPIVKSEVVDASVGERTLTLKSRQATGTGDGARCEGQARALLAQRDPVGLAIVEAAGTDPPMSLWLNCEDPVFQLGTAVHESSHVLDFNESTFTRLAFRLSDTRTLRMSRTEMFPRAEIVEYLGESDGPRYQESYLQGASGRQDIGSVLSELNAYTHGLNTNAALVDNIPKNRRMSSRDGVATQMYYLELYVRRARREHPKQYQRLAADTEILEVIQELWTQAETVLARTQDEERLGIRDASILEKVYAEESIVEMTGLFEAGNRRFRYQR